MPTTGQPRALLICAYDSTNYRQSQRGVRLSRFLQVEEHVDAVLRQVNAFQPLPSSSLMPGPFGGRVRQMCTLRGGAQTNYLMRFTFQTDSVWVSTAVEPNSCISTSNGLAVTNGAVWKVPLRLLPAILPRAPHRGIASPRNRRSGEASVIWRADSG